MNRTLRTALLTILPTLLISCSFERDVTRSARGEGVTIVALGDGGERNGESKAIGNLIARMQTGEHDGGRTDMILFLGDNFYPTGLNIPAKEVDGTVSSVLGPFEETMENLGPDRVHAVAGNHDYYTGHAFEASALFGLINIAIGPTGLSDLGNQRAGAIESWTYHYEMPAEALVPIGEGEGPSVSFIFFDSARLLRTDRSRWSAALDSLRTLLRNSASRPDIAWRILAVHHPFYSVGEHGGFTDWNDVTGGVDFLTPCDKDSNAVSWFKNFIDPEDLCAERYRGYVDSVKSIIAASGAKVDMVMAGHDHSLQLLSYPGRDSGCEGCPRVHIVSGSVSKVSTVRDPHPPEEYTAYNRKSEGMSVSGFAQVTFRADEAVIRFFHGKRGELIDMGDGKTTFRIGRDGSVIAE